MRWVIVLIAGSVVMAGTSRISVASELHITRSDDPRPFLKKLKPGDRLVLEPGIYRKQWTVSGVRGTRDRPIVIEGQPGVVFRPDDGRDGILFWGGGGSRFVIVRGIRFEEARRAGIVVNGSRNIRIERCVFADNETWGVQTCLSEDIAVVDCELRGSRREHGVYFSTTDRPLLKDCLVRDNAACGVHMNGDLAEGGDGMITGARIEGNVIMHNGARGGAAVNMDGVERSIVSNNLVLANESGGIVSFCENGASPGGSNVFTRNTVFFEEGKGRFGLALEGQANGNVIRENVLVCGRGPALQLDRTAMHGLTCSGNLYFSMRGKPLQLGFRGLDLKAWKREVPDRGSVVKRPVFRAPGQGDYRLLREEGSPPRGCDLAPDRLR